MSGSVPCSIISIPRKNTSETRTSSFAPPLFFTTCWDGHRHLCGWQRQCLETPTKGSPATDGKLVSSSLGRIPKEVCPLDISGLDRLQVGFHQPQPFYLANGNSICLQMGIRWTTMEQQWRHAHRNLHRGNLNKRGTGYTHSSSQNPFWGLDNLLVYCTCALNLPVCLCLLPCFFIVLLEIPCWLFKTWCLTLTPLYMVDGPRRFWQKDVVNAPISMIWWWIVHVHGSMCSLFMDLTCLGQTFHIKTSFVSELVFRLIRCISKHIQVQSHSVLVKSSFVGPNSPFLLATSC